MIYSTRHPARQITRNAARHPTTHPTMHPTRHHTRHHTRHPKRHLTRHPTRHDTRHPIRYHIQQYPTRHSINHTFPPHNLILPHITIKHCPTTPTNVAPPCHPTFSNHTNQYCTHHTILQCWLTDLAMSSLLAIPLDWQAAVTMSTTLTLIILCV